MPRHLEAEFKLLQIPVKKSVADRIAEYGSKVTKSQAQFALACLEVAFENREGFLDRLSDRLVRVMGEAIPKTRTFRKQVREDEQIVRLQVPVPVVMVAKLEQVGNEMNHTPVQTAGWLLERIVTDEDWIVRAVLSPLILEVTRWVQGLGKSKGAGSSGLASGERQGEGAVKRRGPRASGSS